MTVVKAKEKPRNKKKYASKRAQIRARNKRRVERYETDAEYQEHMKSNARKTYRAKKQGLVNCSHNAVVDGLGEIGQLRDIKSESDEKLKAQITFDINETAEALGGYNAHVIYRWIREGMIPPMVNTAVSGNSVAKVYLLKEMKVICKHLQEHQKEVCYFSKRNTLVIGNIKNDIASIRRS